MSGNLSTKNSAPIGSLAGVTMVAPVDSTGGFFPDRELKSPLFKSGAAIDLYGQVATVNIYRQTGYKGGGF